MGKGIFILGTDTGVGKTVIAGAIARALSLRGTDVGVMKPIETGCALRNGKYLPEDGGYLKMAARVDDPIDLITPYAYKDPVAPWVASVRERREIRLDKIKEAFGRLRQRRAFLVVEGVGGLVVPLTAHSDLIDLIRLLDLPVLLVARSGLGTLNHTLLTLRYGSDQGLRFLGVLLNRVTPKATLADQTNPETLRKRTDIPLLGCLPYFRKGRLKEDNIEHSKDLLMKTISLMEIVS